MNPLLRTARAVGVLALAVITIQLGALVASRPADASVQTAVATAGVNIRSGPGTNYARLGMLQPGQSVEVTGRQGGWVKVTWNGRTAWIISDYLSIRDNGATGIAGGGASGTRYSTDRLNVRTGPSLSSTVVTTVNRGTAFVLTGRVSNGFSEATYQGATRWVYTAYLTSAGPQTAPTTLPKVTGQMRLTGLLLIRSDDTPNFTAFGKAPIGTIIDVTGVARNGVVQAVYQGQVRWFDANWVVPVGASQPAPVAPSVPGTIGTRTSSSNLNVRASATSGSALLATAPAGTVFNVTGAVSGGYAEIVWSGRRAWVAAQTLVASKGETLNSSYSSGLDSLLPAGKGIVRTVREQFPQISVMYGVRFDSIADHPSGKAVDIMLPNYKANQAMGWTIANYMRANAKRLNIRYIIFAQHIWTQDQDSLGWRPMADRGSDNANHMNHVHVTTY